MNVSMTPELEKFIDDEVKSGLYQTASEVIRAGLRRLKEDKERSKPSFMFSSKEELEQKVMEGISQLERGQCRTIEGEKGLKEFFTEIKTSSRERLKKTNGRTA